MRFERDSSDPGQAVPDYPPRSARSAVLMADRVGSYLSGSTGRRAVEQKPTDFSREQLGVAEERYMACLERPDGRLGNARHSSVRCARENA